MTRPCPFCAAPGPADDARIGSRPVFWDALGARVETPIYEQSLIRAGQWLEGPAVVQAAYTTTVLDPGYRLEADRHLDLIISRP